ncbi:hypothetical protein GCM10009867_00030 [Pedococcus aerophilus]|uniref:Uncharacterized protein n=1 Tax=Pedococcus aerophilus TaxID=436356 RepID=A0ABN3UC38_9MICO
MAFESVRGYVQLASGLGELTMAKAMEAAQGLLSLPGADGVTRKVVQASTLAEELLDVAKSNRANLVALVQGEVESALKRADVVRVADLDAARATLTTVTKELADLKAMVVATGASAVAGASRGSLGRSGAVSTSARATAPAGEVPDAPAPTAAVPAPRRARSTSTAKAPAKKAAPRKAAPRKAAATKSATKSTATKAASASTPAKKTAARRTATTKTAASKTAATKTAAKKATAHKTAAKKTTPRKARTTKATS